MRVYYTLKKTVALFLRFLAFKSGVYSLRSLKASTHDIQLSFTAEAGSSDNLCTSCGYCEMICPTKCIQVELPVNKTVPVLPKNFHFNAATCVYCYLCVDVCPESAIAFSKQDKNAESASSYDYPINLSKPLSKK